MCSQGKLQGDGRHKQDKKVDGERNQKTWSHRFAERLAHKNLKKSSSVSQNKASLEHTVTNEVEFDCLPDLEEDLPDLLPLSGFGQTQSPYFPQEALSAKRRSKERHFLDSFEPSPKQRKLTEESESPKEKAPVCEPEEESSVTGAPAYRTWRRKDRISQELQAGSTPVCHERYKIFSFPADISRASADKRHQADTEIKHIKAKLMGVKFIQDQTAVPLSLGGLCSDFVSLQLSCLEDLSDDLNDPSNFSNSIDLLEDFCSKRKPPVWIIDKLIDNGFFSAADEKVSTRTYLVVLKLWQQFPDLIHISVSSVLRAGDVLQKYLQNNGPLSASINSQLSRQGRERPSFGQARLYFQLFVKGLQMSLSTCTLADQKSVNKCLAYTCLSSDGSKTLIKQVTHWLEFCLVVRHPEHVPVAKQWMCELQSLLGACVLVSRDRQEAAKRLAPDLKRTYKYLTDLLAKKLLLQSFSCPLLCFYVLRMVMEDQCESTIVSSQFPVTIHEVVNNYYFALPPQDHLTPPPSPSEDGNEGRQGQFRLFSMQSCEELAMLVYFISKSFIACKQRRLNSDLRQQILKGPNLPTLTVEEKTFLQHSIQEFGVHLQNHCPELSACTRTYLTLLDCLHLSS